MFCGYESQSVREQNKFCFPAYSCNREMCLEKMRGRTSQKFQTLHAFVHIFLQIRSMLAVFEPLQFDAANLVRG